MEKIKIAFLTRGPFGALGSAASYMFPSILSDYCEVLVLSPHEKLQKEEIVNLDNDLSVVRLVEEEPTARVLEIYRELERFKPDIVHVFQSPFCLLYFSNLMLAFPNTSWVLDFRSPLLTKKMRTRRRMLRRYFYSQLFADKIFSHSTLTIRDNLPYRFRSYTEIPPGVTLNRFSPKKFQNLLLEKFIYVGSVSKSRDIEFIVYAFGEFVEKAQSKRTLDIFGGGDALTEIQQLVKKRNWKFIRIHGAVDQATLQSKIVEFDVGIAYVPNGKFERAPSLKSLEYAAAGLPILASRTSGHLEYEKRYGFQLNMFENNLESFNSVMQNLPNKSLKSQVKNNLKAVEPFDWKRIVQERLLPEYEALVKRKII